MQQVEIAADATGYDGLSMPVFLAQYHKVFKMEVIPEKVEMINSGSCPIQNEFIEKYLSEKDLQGEANKRIIPSRYS